MLKVETDVAYQTDYTVDFYKIFVKDFAAVIINAVIYIAKNKK